jgi:hypothetical protein
MTTRDRTFQEVLIAVEHVPESDEVEPVFRENGLSRVPSHGEAPIESLKRFWAESPPGLAAKYGNVSPQEIAEQAQVLIPKYIQILDDSLNANLKWKYGRENVLGAIKKRVKARLAEVRRKGTRYGGREKR